MDPMVQGQLKEWFLMIVTFGLFGWAAYLGMVIVRRKQKNDMQKALLDKFSSAHDFAEFMQSPAGQKYVLTFADTVTGPFDSIMNSVRIGIVMVFSGGALASFGNGQRWIVDAGGTVLAVTGFGFIVSAVVSYILFRKLKPSEIRADGKD
ncbi:MAG TPA: hypothetical protein VKU42_05155 [Candidatus Angelobacter sp.]|nr:hypothetical protein [Candidatus Angelobacter sp.]